MAQKKKWTCGTDGAAKNVTTAWECAAWCRSRYPSEKYFEFGFIGGSREKECICKKGAGTTCTSTSNDPGFDVYSIQIARKFLKRFATLLQK